MIIVPCVAAATLIAGAILFRAGLARASRDRLRPTRKAVSPADVAATWSLALQSGGTMSVKLRSDGSFVQSIKQPGVPPLSHEGRWSVANGKVELEPILNFEGGRWTTGWARWFIVDDAAHEGQLLLAGDESPDPDGYRLLSRSP